MEENNFPTPVSQSVQSVSPVLSKIPKLKFKTTYIVAALVVLVVGLGSLTGFLVSKSKSAGTLLGVSTQTVPGAKTGANEAGLADETTFKDSAEGTLEEGGISGEGTHHLVRPGGASQNVYLTSTVIDMQSFVGKKVKVWGQTIAAKKAGWLMDVGKIKVVE